MAIVKKQAGFTLVELIVVIVITGILSTFIVQFILLPIESYADVARRTRLVDIANTVIQKVRMDVREALPNSLRVGNCNGGVNNCLELLRAPMGGRYRAIKDTTVSPHVGNALRTGAVDNDGFDVMVPITSADVSDVIRDSNKSSVCSTDLPVYVAVNNTGETGGDAWELESMAELENLTVGLNFSDNATLVEFDGGPGFQFTASNYQRFFLVDTPIKYVWDSSNSRIDRYRCYTINTAATADTVPGVTPDILAARITNVTFSYQKGTAELPIGLLTVSVTVKEASGSESVTLLQQIQVVNMS